jgi:hypothetical protein
VLRIGPWAVVASVIVKPDGSMRWRKTTPPDVVVFSLSWVVLSV